MSTFANPAPVESDARNEPVPMDLPDKPQLNGAQVNGSATHLSDAPDTDAPSDQREPAQSLASAPLDADTRLPDTLSKSTDSRPAPTSANSQEHMETEQMPAEQSSKDNPADNPSLNPDPPATEDALPVDATNASAASVIVKNEDAPDVQPTHEGAPTAVQGNKAVLDEQFEDVMDVENDAATAKISREREDDDGLDERSAKRAKTEEANNDVKMEDSSQPVQTSDTAQTTSTASAVQPVGGSQPQYAPISASTNTTGDQQLVPMPLPPPTPSFDSGDMTELQKKKLAEGLRNVKKSKAAQAFLKAVDPVALNIPNYPKIVKDPMDLGTIEIKLRDGKYANVDAYIADWDLMVNNSILFNGQQHVVAQQGLQARSQMQAQLRRMPKSTDPLPVTEAKKPRSPSVVQPAREASRRVSMPKTAPETSTAPAVAPTPPPAPTPAANEPSAAPNGVPTIRRGSSTNLHRPKREIHKPSRELAYQHSKPVKKKHKPELDFCKHVLDEMTRPRYETLFTPFAKPVDPVALAIPMYFKIVKKPMDLSTVRDKLNRGQYQTSKEFEADIKLIWNNCLKFNGEGHPLVNIAREYERMFDEELGKKAEWLATNAPKSPPASPVEMSEVEDEEPSEDEDEPSNELLAIQQQMQELQQRTAELMAKQQKAAQKKQSSASKKAAKGAKAAAKTKRKSGGAGGKGEKKTKGAGGRPKRPLTTAEKTEISTKIGNLDSEEILKAANIIKTALRAAGKHELADKAEDEMEFDIDTIPDVALHDLLKLVRKSVLPADGDAPATSSRQYHSSKTKKNKPMNKAEQANQIARLEGQLAHFEQGTSPGEEGEDSDDDSDDSGSESEEE